MLSLHWQVNDDNNINVTNDAVCLLCATSLDTLALRQFLDRQMDCAFDTPDVYRVFEVNSAW